LLGHVRTTGERLVRDLRAVPAVRDVRAAGLLVAVELAGPVAARVADLALDAGFVVNPVTPSALRLAPPLIITSAQLQGFVDFLTALPEPFVRGEEPA